MAWTRACSSGATSLGTWKQGALQVPHRSASSTYWTLLTHIWWQTSASREQRGNSMDWMAVLRKSWRLMVLEVFTRVLVCLCWASSSIGLPTSVKSECWGAFEFTGRFRCVDTEYSDDMLLWRHIARSREHLLFGELDDHTKCNCTCWSHLLPIWYGLPPHDECNRDLRG